MEGDRLSTVKKIPAARNNPEPEVSVNWRRTGGEASPDWVRLWRKLLLASRKEKPANTRLDASEGECKDGKNGRTVPD